MSRVFSLSIDFSHQSGQDVLRIVERRYPVPDNLHGPVIDGVGIRPRNWGKTEFDLKAGWTSEAQFGQWTPVPCQAEVQVLKVVHPKEVDKIVVGILAEDHEIDVRIHAGIAVRPRSDEGDGLDVWATCRPISGDRQELGNFSRSRRGYHMRIVPLRGISVIKEQSSQSNRNRQKNLPQDCI
jgi:hypothetical protein